MTLLARLNAYAAHDDPATRTANIIAMVVGWNCPFYPVYMVFLLGWSVALPSLMTTLATPFFLVIPMMSRRSPSIGRLALPLIGTANTLWCLRLLGQNSGVGLFFLPCIALAALLHRENEKPLLVIGMTIPFVMKFVAALFVGEALIPLDIRPASSMTALNEGSVASLTGFIAWQFSELLRSQGDGAEVGDGKSED